MGLHLYWFSNMIEEFKTRHPNIVRISPSQQKVQFEYLALRELRNSDFLCCWNHTVELIDEIVQLTGFVQLSD